MTELNDIFAHDLTKIAFVWGSVAMLIAFAIAALWPVGSTRGARAPVDRAGIRASASSPAAATAR